jgi:hypothetical protein
MANKRKNKGQKKALSAPPVHRAILEPIKTKEVADGRY